MSLKIKLFYALLALLLVISFWPSEDNVELSAIRVWNAHVNANGQLDVLGVVLGKSTLKEAELALHSQSERAMFVEVTNEQATETIEAYFPTSPDRAKMIIELDAPDELIQRIKERAHKTMVFPSGSAKIEIAPEDMTDVETLTAKSITYIPPVSLDAALVTKNFGPAEQQISDNDHNLHLLYPPLGLDVILPQDGKPLLQFVPPNEFERLLQLLPTATGEQ